MTAVRARTIRGARHRWSVASRVLAAVVGGYIVTSLMTLALTLALTWIGTSQAEALMASTIASFLVYAAIVMAAFHVRTASRAWMGLVLAAIPCGAIIALSKLTGGF